MIETEHTSRVTAGLVALLVLLGLWTTVSPFVLRGAENVPVHIGIGVAITALALWYLIRVLREPDTKIPSMWYVLVLGALLLSGAVLTYATGSAFFWSTVVTTGLVVVIAILSICWGSRFLSGSGEETTIFG